MKKRKKDLNHPPWKKKRGKKKTRTKRKKT
jgi:hypothetical protein